MRFAVVVSFAVFLAAQQFAAAEESRSASLLVSATVVSSCSVATANGQVAFRCSHGARGPVRINGQNQPAPDPREAPTSRTSVSGSLVTVDF